MQLSDQEQKQLLKDWWKKYGNAVLLGLLFFLIVNFSWQHWQKYREEKIEHASVTYSQLLHALELKKTDEARLFAKHLQDGFATSSYASLAALLVAKLSIQEHNFAQAATELDWVLHHSKDSNLREIARIREARVLLALHKPQDVLKLLTEIDDNSFMPLILEVKGDALLALGKNKEAALAYKEALQAAGSDASSPLIKMKAEQ